MALLIAITTATQAGFGHFRRGGCSDPCAAAACGGYGATGCASCGSAASVAGCVNCGVSHSMASAQVHAQAQISAGPTGCAACDTTAVQTQSAAVLTQQTDLMDCGPVTSYRVVMEPKYFTETRVEPVTTYQEETRYRTRSVPRQVAVEVQDYRSTTVMVPKTETKTVEYTVLVPQKNEKTVTVKEMVPVWNEVTDTYTVRVPNVVDVPEEYTVRVAKLRDEEFNYTVFVPQAQTQTKMQTVTNAVPVTKTRTVQVLRPVTRMETVTRDYGHWEVRVEEAAAPTTAVAAPAPISMGGCGTYSGNCASCGGCGQVYSTYSNGCMRSSTCGGCGGCGVQQACGGCGQSACGGCGHSNAASCGAVASTGTSVAPCAQTISRRVWVPNVVTEEVPVTENVTETQEVTYTAFEQKTEQIPYECTYIVYAPEERSGSRQVVDYVNETRTRNRKVVQYNQEQRTRTRKELSYKEESRTETIPFVTYTTEKKTKEVSFTVNVPETKLEPITTTRFDTVTEEVSEAYTVRVPVQSTKEVQVQVSRMVPKLVPMTIYPCSSAGQRAVGGCASCGTPTLAPQLQQSGCAGCDNGCAGCR